MATAVPPLKFFEAGHQKSVTVVGLRGTYPSHHTALIPLRDLGGLRGTYEALTFRGFV